MTRPTSKWLWAALLLAGLPAMAQYSRTAGQNAPSVSVKEQFRDDRGRLQERTVEKQAPKDGHGNAQGNQFDLAVDGAFEGETVVVIQLFPFDFEPARAALKQKGFGVVRYQNTPPSPAELEKSLAKANQLWLISSDVPHLNEKHLAAIKRFFDAGHGVYIWGDNQAVYADANALGRALLDVTMSGDLPGDHVVGLASGDGAKGGLLRGHLLTTGLEYLYEGITIATIQQNSVLTPLLHGSAGNLVVGFYDRNGKRAVFDGGFTRLYNKWDTAGTGRYVKNAAAWLANVERFKTATR